jgi:hypothetical protein
MHTTKIKIYELAVIFKISTIPTNSKTTEHRMHFFDEVQTFQNLRLPIVSAKMHKWTIES